MRKYSLNLILMLMLIFILNFLFLSLVYAENKEAIKIMEEVKENIAKLAEEYSKEEIDVLISKCESAINLDKKYVSAYIHLGICYLLKGDADKVIEVENEAIKLDSSNLDAYFFRGWAYLRKVENEDNKKEENYKNVISNLEFILSKDQDYETPIICNNSVGTPEIMFTLGICYKNINKIDKAKEIFQKIIDRFKDKEDEWVEEAKNELEKME